jgi:hypothetical protein
MAGVGDRGVEENIWVMDREGTEGPMKKNALGRAS